MWRVGITTKKGNIISENFKTKEKCETFILEQAEKLDIKKAIIVNKKNIKERFIEQF